MRDMLLDLSPPPLQQAAARLAEAEAAADADPGERTGHGAGPGPHRMGRRRRLGRRGALGHLLHDRGAPAAHRGGRPAAVHALGRRAEAPRPRGAAALRRRRAAPRRARQLPRRARQGVARGRAAGLPEDDPAHQPRPPAARRGGQAGRHARGAHRVGARRIVRDVARRPRGPPRADRRGAPPLAGGAQEDAGRARRVPAARVDGQRRVRVTGARHQVARSSASRPRRPPRRCATTR